MTVDEKIRDEKLQYIINTEAAKISALSSGKTNKYESENLVNKICQNIYSLCRAEEITKQSI